jgi:2,3-bisphosphoglycerate-independent phosphoglycerate mutase
VKATVIRAEGQADAAMEDGDALIFMNFRADRAREITRAFVNATSTASPVRKWLTSTLSMLTEYAADIKARALTHQHLWQTPSASGWRRTTKRSCVFRN